MSNSITSEQITQFRGEFTAEPRHLLTRNALTTGKFEDVAMNWDAFRVVDHQYSDTVKLEMKITDQKHSGRCWGFAGLNLLRLALGTKFKLENFEFSQNYFMFCDKLEKANYFLENILLTLNEPLDSRIVMFLLSEPIQDGGQWDMFVNLLEKYGAVPQSVMPESTQSSNSHNMNGIISCKLREFAKTLRSGSGKGQSVTQLRKQKPAMMQTIYNLLCMNLGTPPEKFDWQIRDKDKNFIRFSGLTPLQFYCETVGVDLKEKICLINAPMRNKSFNTLYTVQYLGNVAEGRIVKYINMPSDMLKTFAMTSIRNNEAVWFGCDVGKMYHPDLGVMDTQLYDLPLLFNTEFTLAKGSKLEYGDSMMTHAMLLTGVNIVNEKSTKWRVENSWGEKRGDKGYFLMTDDWFDEFLYEIVIDKKYLPDEILSIYETEPVVLPPWDPFGALARNRI